MSGDGGLVARLWNYCNVLRDDGLSYQDYLEQLTFLLFLKMADEQTKPPFSGRRFVPEGLDWESLLERDGEELEAHYIHLLRELGKEPGMLGIVFRGAQNRIQDPAKLRRLIVDLIDKERWMTLDVDVKGEAYEGLLQRNAEDLKSGAGQYFTPRPLISAIVEVMRPEAGMTICDPACGTGGFLLAAYEWIVSSTEFLDPDQRDHLRFESLRGWEIVENAARLCVMNLLLHGIGAEDAPSPIEVDDALRGDPGERFDIVLTNPPFGRKSSLMFVNEGGEAEREDLTVVRDDFWASTSNKQLNFLQHVKTLLKPGGRAAIVVPDNVLFEGGAGETIRRKLLHECDVHTLLRLPTGLFYAQGVKANVLFFDRKPASEAPWTKELWIYDLRTNQHFTLKQKPLRRDDVDEFVELYKPGARHEREESERFKRFTYDDLLARDKVSLDLTWLRDELLEDVENLQPPEVIAQEIVEDLQAALFQFTAIAESLEGLPGGNSTPRVEPSSHAAADSDSIGPKALSSTPDKSPLRPARESERARKGRSSADDRSLPPTPEPGSEGYRDLVQCLREAGRPLTPEELMSASGFESSNSHVFYAALGEAVSSNRITELRRQEGGVLLELSAG